MAIGLAGPSWAELSVGRHAFARDVIAREPVGEAKAFPSDVGEVYFFTQILGARAPTGIVHVWIYDGREMAVIPLSVEADPWRTWSAKRIPPHLIGDWTVEVRDRAGNVIFSDTCRIE